jgi:hypothetical protein
MHLSVHPACNAWSDGKATEAALGTEIWKVSNGAERGM